MRLSKFKKIYFILPCPIKQIERGQVKVAFKQAIAFKKLGFIPVLINIWFKSKKEISKNKKVFSNAFDEIYGIDIYFSDLFECFYKSIIQRFINQIPLQVNLINSKRIKTKFGDLMDILINQETHKSNLIYLFSIRSFPLWEILKNKEIFYAINLVDSVSLNIKSKCKNLGGIKKLFWELEYYAIKNFENNLPNSSKLLSYIAVSKIDIGNFKIKNVEENKRKLIQNSIGVDFKTLKLENDYKKFMRRKILIFTGTLYYEPNITAIHWLVKEIMPIVWSNDSQVKLHIAGRSPSKKVVELSNLDQRIRLFKNPINIENHIYESTISLAPMISGSGQQFKIIEAMALSKPVISTSKASNPFGLEKNYNVLISDNAIDFADSILKLLNDEKLYFKLISNCRYFIEKNHCWESLSKNLIDQLEANI